MWMVTWIVQNTRVILFNILKWHVNALCSHRRDIYFMHDLAPCHNSKSTRVFLDCKEITVLEWPGNLPDMNLIENFWNVMKKEIGNQMPCKIVEMWKRVFETWYSVAVNVLVELYNYLLRRFADLIEANEGATKYWLYDVGVHCCCVFIGMYLK